MDSTTIEQLVDSINKASSSLTKRLKELGEPQPSFKKDAPAVYPEDQTVKEAKTALLDATRLLEHLTQGPEDYIKWNMVQVSQQPMRK